MTSKLIPFKTPIAIGALQSDGSVLMSTDFQRWLNRQLVTRVGGTDAMTNLELAQELAALTLTVTGLASAQAALTLRVSAVEAEEAELAEDIAKLAAGEMVLQPSVSSAPLEMIFQ